VQVEIKQESASKAVYISESAQVNDQFIIEWKNPQLFVFESTGTKKEKDKITKKVRRLSGKKEKKEKSDSDEKRPNILKISLKKVTKENKLRKMYFLFFFLFLFLFSFLLFSLFLFLIFFFILYLYTFFLYFYFLSYFNSYSSSYRWRINLQDFQQKCDYVVRGNYSKNKLKILIIIIIIF